MLAASIDLLAIPRGTVTAPAGCGKTQLIADALQRYDGRKPILVLTHTNAGVAALRGRLERAGVPPSGYRLSTIDGWAMRLIGMFPARSAHDREILTLRTPATHYPAIRDAAVSLLKDGHIRDVLDASYARLIVDEYQDCGLAQHALVCHAADGIPTCVLGDPLQAVFGFRDPLVDWETDVGGSFPFAGELATPWRWKNAGQEPFGRWLLECRTALRTGAPIDLAAAPANVQWVQLHGDAEDYKRQLKAGLVKPPHADGKILIMGNSRNPPAQSEYARRTPGAVTVENVDLRDLVDFGDGLDLTASYLLRHVVIFATSVMTNVGADDFLSSVDAHQRGVASKQPTDADQAALDLLASPSFEGVAELISQLNQLGGVRTHRPALLRACFSMLDHCAGPSAPTPGDAARLVREQSRLIGRPLAKRTVGSTLLLKGLEAEVAVILDADAMSAAHLYVAMTRGSHGLVVCARSSTLHPR